MSRTRKRNESSSLTREDALVYLRRFPAQGRVAVATNIALVLAGNAIVLWLLISGRVRAAHLIALTMAETALLIAITWSEQRLVPRRDWLEQPKPWRQTIPLIAFVLVWLGFAYGVTLMLVGGGRDFLSLFHSMDAWIDAGLHWPLLYTLALALLHATWDLADYRRVGGPFLSSVGMDAMARYLTLLLGAIPFAMPFFVLTIGGFNAVDYVFRKARVAPEQSLLAAGALALVAFGSFALIGTLISSGVAGWAIGFVLAKLMAETLVACIPLLMVRVARGDP